MNAKEKQQLVLLKQMFETKQKADLKYERKKAVHKSPNTIIPLKKLIVSMEQFELQNQNGESEMIIKRIQKTNIKDTIESYDANIKSIKQTLLTIKYETLFELIEEDTIESILENKVIPLEKDLEKMKKKKEKLIQMIEIMETKKREDYSTIVLNKNVEKEKLMKIDELILKRELIPDYLYYEKTLYAYKEGDKDIIEISYKKENDDNGIGEDVNIKNDVDDLMLGNEDNSEKNNDNSENNNDNSEKNNDEPDKVNFPDRLLISNNRNINTITKTIPQEDEDEENNNSTINTSNSNSNSSNTSNSNSNSNSNSSNSNSSSSSNSNNNNNSSSEE